MTELRVEVVDIPNGYSFIRSDGERFFMLGDGARGDAWLYSGADPNNPPAVAIIILDVNFFDKVERAIKHVLAYPNRLNDQDIVAKFPGC